MEILIPIIFLNIGAFSFSRLFRIESTISYLIVLMFSLDFIYFGSLVDKLKPAMTVCFAGLIALFIFYLKKTKGKYLLKDAVKYCNVHTVLNLASTFIYFGILKAKNVTLYYWDEIRIWGPSAKSVKLFNRLYSIGINPNSHDRNYPAGNALLNYLFSFFTDNFSEIILLTSYAILFFAVFSAAAKLVEVKTKNRALSIGTYFAFMMLPFLQNYHTIDKVGYSSISYAYGTSMVDFNVAVVFLAIFVIYFYNTNKFWYVLPSIYLVTVKKNGIFFVLLAFCVIFVFEFFIGKFNLKKAGKLVVTLLMALVVPVMSYLAWNMHLDHYDIPITKSEYQLKQTSVERTIRITPLESEELLVQPKKNPSRISIILSGLQTERYKEIMEEMKWYFSEFEELVYLKDKYLIVLLLAAGIVTAFLADKKYRIPLVLTSIGLTIACFVYNMCIAYQMQFYNDQMVEYPRYMISYYYGWLYVILAIVLIFPKDKTLLKKIIVFSIFAFSLWYLNEIGTDRTIINATDAQYHHYRQLEKKLENVNKTLENEDRVLLVWMSGYDDILYSHIYYLDGVYCNKDTRGTDIDFSVNFRNPDVYTGGETYFNYATETEFIDILKNYFDYVYVCNEYDRDFEVSYGSLFEGGMERDALYKVIDSEIPLQRVVY